MSHSKPHCHTSIRAFSRRPRLSVASIADVFVTSLVLAGFCHEHSPRVRQFSTASSRAPEQLLRSYRVKGIAGRGQLLSGSRPGTSHFPVQPSRGRSWLSAGLAHSEESPFQQNYAATATRKRISGNSDDALTTLDGDTDGRSRGQFEEPSSDLIPRSNRDFTLERDKSGRAGTITVDEEGSNDTLAPDGKRSFSYDEKSYIATARLYRRILGREYNWKAAVDALMAIPRPNLGVVVGRDEIERPSVQRFTEVLYSKPIPTTQHLFRLYRDIPAPGVTRLSKTSRGHLLRQLANSPNRRWADSRRYLAVVEDMVAAGLRMSPSIWASAIYFAGRGNGSGKVKRKDLIRAIGIWQQMEHLGGMPADATVFEILFSVAVKAGQYTVAERLEEEMRSRGLDFGRFGMMTKIFYQGLCKDVYGISRTFEEFVKSGGIVDTVALNCLCASYLRAGETDLAEQIYARMIAKQRQSRQNKSPQRYSSLLDDLSPAEPVLSSEFVLYRRNTRQLGHLLKQASPLRKQLPEYHRAIQDSLPMTPDTRTFYIFLRHFSLQTGQLDMCMSVIRDMENTFAIPPRHMIYMLLFEGFGLHGRRIKSWSAKKLRLIWHSYLQAVHESRTRLDSLGKGIKPSEAVWENPLEPTSISDGDFHVPESDPAGFYMPLPSEKDPVGIPDGVDESMPNDTSDSAVDGREGLPHDSTEMDGQQSILMDAILDLSSDLDVDPGFDHAEYFQRRLDNGVFVGRKMIIIILRAFGVCCGPKEVLEVWLQLERLWNTDHRKANDVFAVKEELDKQMSKDPPRPDEVG